MARRDQILAMHGKLKELPAQLPGPDGPVDVIVREMQGREAQDFEEALAQKRPNTLGMLIQLAVVDPDTHERMFEVGDRQMLEELGMTGLKPVIETIQSLAGITSEDLEKLKANLARTL